MPIPAFTIDGVIPPFVGTQGPGDAQHYMTPYEVTPLDVVARFSTTPNRREILRLWLKHRSDLRSFGLDRGFQWLDGSFVEDREPNDLDVVTFIHRPLDRQEASALVRLFKENPDVFSRRMIKSGYRLDVFFVDLDATVERTIDIAVYFLGLFSHRRMDTLWKGMLRVPLATAADDDAASFLMDGDRSTPTGSAEVR